MKTRIAQRPFPAFTAGIAAAALALTGCSTDEVSVANERPTAVTTADTVTVTADAGPDESARDAEAEAAAERIANANVQQAAADAHSAAEAAAQAAAQAAAEKAAEKAAKEKADKKAKAKAAAKKAAKEKKAKAEFTATGNTTRWVNVGTANVRSGPGTNHGIVGSRSWGDKVSGPTNGEWIKLGDRAFISVATTSANEPVQAAPQPPPPSDPGPTPTPPPPPPSPQPPPPSAPYLAPSVSFGKFTSCTKINSNTWQVTYTYVASGGRYTDLGNAFDSSIHHVDGGTRVWTYQSTVGGFGGGADPQPPTQASVFYSQRVNNPGVTDYATAWTLSGVGSFPISICS